MTTAAWAAIFFAFLFVATTLYATGALNSITRGFASAPGVPSVAGCTATGSYKISGSVTDAFTQSALGATTTADIILPSGPQGWTAPAESPTQSSSVFTSTNYYPACTQFFIHAASTAGNKYYDRLFGPFVTGVFPFLPAQTTTAGFTWSQAAGILGLKQMATGSTVKYLLVDSLGKACGNTATAGTAQAGNTVQGGSTGAVTQNLLLTVQLTGGSSTSVVNYGEAVPIITASGGLPASPGPGSSQTVLVAYLATNQTSGNQWITQAGWTPTTNQPNPTVGTLFYKILPPIESSKQVGGTASVLIPLDLTNGPGSGKNEQVAIWIRDMQNTVDAANAVPDTTPTAFGAYSTIGMATVDSSLSAWTIASGRWTTYTINCAVHQ